MRILRTLDLYINYKLEIFIITLIAKIILIHTFLRINTRVKNRLDNIKKSF